MADLLPSTPDTSAAETTSPRVIGLSEGEADKLLEALSSETARLLLDELHTEPAPASELATRCEMSIQNTQYHLEQLLEVELIEVIDTVYSEKGREMDVYAPADRPLVVVAGDTTQADTLKDRLPEFLGGLGILAGASLIVEAVLSGWFADLFEDEPEVTMEADEPVEEDAPAPEPEPTVGVDEALGLPPGAIFFLGGLLVLVVLVAYRHWRG